VQLERVGQLLVPRRRLRDLAGFAAGDAEPRILGDPVPTSVPESSVAPPEPAASATALSVAA
jgi:hypothetical protein